MPVLVDTSVWIDHFRRGSPALIDLLNEGEVAQHPMVIGELAMGGLQARKAILRELGNLPGALAATHDEVVQLVENAQLHGRGLGLVDAHLLASTILSPGMRLWTRDRALSAAAQDAGVLFAG